MTDSEVAGSCDVGVLAPGASDDACTFIYQVQQSDIDAGTFENTATATATADTPAAPAVDGTGDET